ncbi:hypothetical protein M8J76_008528 [Diaphorina citri]|nr:hypothetical protein M8J76_008528 [Diaphorina citri]
MALYFNVIFCPVWLCTTFFLLYLKYDQLSMLYRLINVTVLVLIPELAGFWMISCLIQFPLQCMLLFNQVTLPRPVETIFQAIMCSMLCVEIYAGFGALRRSAKHHATTFQIRQAHM